MNQAPASTWVLLRGLTREAAHWGEGPNALPHLLRQALPGAAIHRPDLPGNGRLHGLRSPATVQGMVAACRAEMARQGIRPPFHLLAMSLGAMVAAEWAHQAPHEVAGCVLINTSVRPFSPVHHRLRPRNWPTLLRHGLWPATPREREATVLRLTSNLAQQRSEVLDRWVAVRREHPVRAVNALRQLLAAARYRAPRLAPPLRCCCWPAPTTGWSTAAAHWPWPKPGTARCNGIPRPGTTCHWTIRPGWSARCRNGWAAIRARSASQRRRCQISETSAS